MMIIIRPAEAGGKRGSAEGRRLWTAVARHRFGLAATAECSSRRCLMLRSLCELAL
jgi:hypothetical protein